LSENDYARLLKKYRKWKITSIILTVIIAVIMYVYYDYTVFKILISGNYIFTDALDEIYSQAIGDENVKGYFRDFDRMVISVVTERLREAKEQLGSLGIGSSNLNAVTKTYPTTTHAHTIEYRLESREALERLFNNVTRAWSNGRARGVFRP